MSAVRAHQDERDVITADPQEAKSVARVLNFVEAHFARHGEAPAAQFFLSGATPQDRVELTPELFIVLKQAADQLSKGRSVQVFAQDQEISTQEAADLLGLSRPTVVKLIEAGDLTAIVPGKTRRRLRLAEVLDYRDHLHERRSNFIAETSADIADADPKKVAELLKEARRTRSGMTAVGN